MNLNKDLYDAMQLGLFWVINIIIGVSIVLLIDLIDRKWIFKNSVNIKSIFSLKNHINLLREKSVFDYKALIISCRVALTFIILLLINRHMQWSFIDIQALIAGIIISAQPTIAMTHQRALMRLLGVIGGAILAIIFAYVLQIYPSIILTIIFMAVTLGFLTLLSEYFKFWEYAFLQAGLMLPLILITSSAEMINVRMAIERSLGSLEGGFVAVAMVYLSLLFINWSNKNKYRA